MKLIYCKECGDIVRLFHLPLTCECGASGGVYVNDINAEIWGEVVPLGIDNLSFIEALKGRPKEGEGSLFTAFVIPEECKTVKEV